MKMLTKFTQSLLAYPKAYFAWQSLFAQRKVEVIGGDLDRLTPKSVLDLGCGPGINRNIFGEVQYFGVDISPAYIEIAQKQFADNFFVGDITTDLPLPTEFFDLILVNSVLHHLDENQIALALAAMGKYLKAGGELFILEPTLSTNDSALIKCMANLDRGSTILSFEHWLQKMEDSFSVESYQRYDLGILGVSLWKMVYFRMKAHD